ncbi:hypothetical protein H9645_05345 [Luteimonas sp. Sa2BVA3]|uniref:Uncharacterized protein n=1 Tax=Luteimonas colneyensis TaxID=2762230 RepID=A0ABR8UIK1_9GAMM|nr:hypothetical protein [Luteimonas colneyensis]MBD7987449.1 hypothetical protein [Luteimonas colneyensis]
MELKQNPFSLYDFLGYFTPGAILLYIAGYFGKIIWPGAPTFHDVAAQAGLEKAEAYVPFVLFAYAIGHLLSFVSSVTIERYSIWAMGYPSKYLLGVSQAGYFHSDRHPAVRAVIRSAVFALILPISLMDLVLGRLLGMRDLYAKPLDDLLIQIIREKVYKLIQVVGGVENPAQHGKAYGTDFFRFAYHYAVENAPHHLPKMQNYVALFGFLRNMSLIVVIAFWPTAYAVVKGLVAWPALLALAVVSYLCFMAFVKFYRRFCLEALMATAVSYNRPAT